MSELAQTSPLALLTELVERVGEQQTDELARLRALTVRQDHLEASIAAVANRVEAVYRGTRPLRMSKQAAAAMTCEACGGSYAAEPGPPLCGRCWCELGRPSIWPLPESRRA